MKGLGGMQRLKQVEVSERVYISLLVFADFASCKPYLQMDMPPKCFVDLLHAWKERTVMQAIHCNSGIHSYRSELKEDR